jgi:hypothetical protein
LRGFAHFSALESENEPNQRYENRKNAQYGECLTAGRQKNRSYDPFFFWTRIECPDAAPQPGAVTEDRDGVSGAPHALAAS